MKRHYRQPTDVRVGEDGRWVLGDKNARCHHCGAPAAVHYASNGRAEFWHAPTDCCNWSKAREIKFSDMARTDERFTADMDARAKGWYPVEDVA